MPQETCEPLMNSHVIDWKRIENFVGYGNAEAAIVFVGMEEGLASVDALESDLLCRSGFKQVMDVEVAHRCLAKGPRLFTDRPRGQRTWRVMADVMLHFEHQLPQNPAERRRARTMYRAKYLGRSNGGSLLTELLPYPSTSTARWPYARFGKFNSRNEYESKMLESRVRLLRSAIQDHPRRAIICYGRGDWRYFKLLFPEVKRWNAAGRMESAIWNGAKVALTDHFVTKYFNS